MSNTQKATNKCVQTALDNGHILLLEHLFKHFNTEIDLNKITLNNDIVLHQHQAFDFILKKGYPLPENEMEYVINHGSVKSIEVLSNNFRERFLYFLNKNPNCLMNILLKSHVEKIEFLKKEGVIFTTKHLPLETLIHKLYSLEGFEIDLAIRTALAHIPYSNEDCDMLYKTQKQSFFYLLCRNINAKNKDVFLASKLNFLLDDEDFLNAIVSQRNHLLLSTIQDDAQRLDKITDIPVDSIDVINTPYLFNKALRQIQNTSKSHLKEKITLTSIFVSDNISALEIASDKLPLLIALKKGSFEDNDILISTITNASKTITSNEMVDAFFNLLHHDLLVGKDLLNEIFLRNVSHQSDTFLYFINKLKERGIESGIDCYKNMIHNLRNCTEAGRMIDAINLNGLPILLQAPKEYGDELYHYALKQLGLDTESKKKIISTYRRNRDSNGRIAISKAIRAAFVIAMSPEHEKVEYLNQLPVKGNLKEDIAFMFMMKVWNIDVIQLLSLPIRDDVKIAIVKATAILS